MDDYDQVEKNNYRTLHIQDLSLYMTSYLLHFIFLICIDNYFWNATSWATYCNKY